MVEPMLSKRFQNGSPVTIIIIILTITKNLFIYLHSMQIQSLNIYICKVTKVLGCQ